MEWSRAGALLLLFINFNFNVCTTCVQFGRRIKLNFEWPNQRAGQVQVDQANSYEMLRLGRTIKPEANEAKCGYEPFSHLAKITKSQMEIEVQCGVALAALECFNNLSWGNRQFNKPAGQNNCQPGYRNTHS